MTAEQLQPIARERIKLVRSGVNRHTVLVDGVAVAVLWGGRCRHRDGVDANFGVDSLDGVRVAEGYSYFADAVKMLPIHLVEAGAK